MSDEFEAKLAALGEATEALGPRPGFAARVMGAVGREPTWAQDVTRLSWRLLPMAAALAVLAVGWAVQMDAVADDAVAVAYDAEEEEW